MTISLRIGIILAALTTVCIVVDTAAATPVCSPSKVRASEYQCDSAFTRSKQLFKDSRRSIEEPDDRYNQRRAEALKAFKICDHGVPAMFDWSKSSQSRERVEGMLASVKSFEHMSLLAWWYEEYKAAKDISLSRIGVSIRLSHEKLTREQASTVIAALDESPIMAKNADALICRAAVTMAVRMPSRSMVAGDLAKIGAARFQTVSKYEKCALRAASPITRADVLYVAMVAAEESGRTFQAANDNRSQEALGKCLLLYDVIESKLGDAVPKYMTDIQTLCKGRLDGRFGVDFPRPFNEPDDGKWHPLILPSPSPSGSPSV